MQFTLEHHDLEMTDPVRAYAEEKFQSLATYADIVKMDVVVGKETAHHQQGEIFYCEAHCFLAGKDFFVKKEEADLYKAIDKVKDHLKNELTEWKDRQISRQREESAI